MMDDTELKINRFLHTVVMGRCWHRWKRASHDYWICVECKAESFDVNAAPSDPDNPDYTSESSPRSLLSEVEAKVLEEKGEAAYGRILASEAMCPPESKMPTYYETGIVATAPASVRAMACAKVCGLGEE